jgi:hypothetical protein
MRMLAGAGSGREVAGAEPLDGGHVGPVQEVDGQRDDVVERAADGAEDGADVVDAPLHLRLGAKRIHHNGSTGCVDPQEMKRDCTPRDVEG